MDPATLTNHFARLYRAAYGLCARREDAEDLVQETYARVLRRPRLLRRDDDIVYLLRVLRNTWISNHRAVSARPVTTDLAEVEWVADPREDPTGAAVEVRAIYAAMRDLPPPYARRSWQSTWWGSPTGRPRARLGQRRARS